MLARSLMIEQANLDSGVQCARLDQWICAHPASTPFHRTAWLKAITRCTGQSAMILVARESADKIVGLVPLNFIDSALFGRALVSTGFAVDGGILADDPAVAQALADACWTLAERENLPTAELRGGMLPENGWTIKTDSYLGFAKRLEADDEKQLLSVPRKHRAELRKGLDKGFDVEIGRDGRMLDIHYRLYAENVHRLGTPVFPKSLFSSVLETFRQDADIILVSKDGVPHTSIFSLYHNDACMPYWHGATLQARGLHSNEVAYFKLMGHARERGCTIFDFGRSKVGTGPAAWKKSWGWEGQPLSYAVRTAQGTAARDINPLSPQYQRKVELWKKLPLPLANIIGPYISRGLG